MRRLVTLVVVPSLVLVAAVVACSSDDAGGGAPGGTPVSGSSGSPSAPPPVPVAEGDACRGDPLPAGKHYVPPGFCARRIASDVSGLRQLAFAPNGDLFGTCKNGDILLFHDANGDGVYAKSEITVWASTTGNGNNAHLDLAGGFVYAGAPDGVKRFAYTAGAPTGGAAEDVVIGQPAGGHTYHTVHVYDGCLYVHSGSSGNASHELGDGSPDYDTKRSLIKRFDLSKLVPGKPFAWDSGEPFTVGLRNTVGFKRNELTKKIYGVVNGVDQLHYVGADIHQDNPGEQIVELAAGKRYGYPFCFTAQRVLANGDTGTLIAPGTQLVNVGFNGNPHDDAWCAANSLPPTTFVQAHSAPLDIAFFDDQPSGVLPEKYRGGAFVALHGSWNRESKQTGYKVVWQPFNGDGSAPMPTSTEATTTFPYEVVLGGGTDAAPEDGAWSVSETTNMTFRPAGLAISPIDGALYISGDDEGQLYRLGLKK
jgi:glucose/arabinose dehydrogenase